MTARPRAGAGFVLVATMWTLAVLAVVASYVDGVVAADVERTRLAKQNLQGELDRRAVEATLLYLLATNVSNHRAWLVPGADGDAGGAELGVAGEVHAAPGGIRYSIQDERGLASVNLPTSPKFAAALRHVGMADRQIARVVPRMDDYIDLNRKLRLNGAEHFDYARHGLPPPADWFLAGPGEIKRVLGLDAVVDDATWRRLRPLLTSRITMGYNFNTMRPELVGELLGLDDATLQAFVARRPHAPIAAQGPGLDDIGELTGVRPRILADDIISTPSPSLRIKTWRAGSGQRAVRGIMLTPVAQAPDGITPLAEQAPWRTEYFYSEPVDEPAAAARQLQTPLLQSP